METILERIIQQKKKELADLRANRPDINDTIKAKRSFIQKLQDSDEISIIAEFKRASPSKGVINNAVEPADQAILYKGFGASAISILTDQTFFKGSFSDLRAVREAVDLPILCKDFIIDPIQIEHAAASGADLILLIVAALNETSLVELFHFAKSIGLEVLIEVHNQEELDKALKTGAKLIGINNRDLRTFHVSLEITKKLAAFVRDKDAYLISESGIHSSENVETVRDAGANGILVGEALMKSTDIKQSFLNFRLPLVGSMKK